jgi:predicted PurR-regulated permease PerM
MTPAAHPTPPYEPAQPGRTAPSSARPAAAAPPASEDAFLASPPRSQVAPRTVVVVVFTLLAIAAGLYLLWRLSEILQWLVIAIFLAVALAPVVDWLSRRLPRVGAILLVYVVLLVAFAGLGALLLPPLVDQADDLGRYLVGLARAPGGFDQTVEELASRSGLAAYVDTIRAQLDTLPARLTGAARPLLALTAGLVGSVAAVASVLLLTFFLLLDGERFVARGLALCPAGQRPRLHRILGQSADAVHGYINGNLFISLIAGVAAFVAITLVGVPYAVPLALVIALFDLIPLVGSTIGSAIVLIVALLVDPIKALILAGYFVLYQQVENNVLQPLVYGRSVRLHPLVIFLAVLVGGELLGILGALLAIPVAEVIRILGAEWLASRRGGET